jgi:hypothetical protein
MTNNEAIRAFVNGTMKRGAVNHIGWNNDKLINYSTTLCEIERDTNTAYFNRSKYSTTTSKIQSALRRELEAAGLNIIECDGEPCYIWNYGYMGAPNLKMEDVYRYC